MSGAPHPTAHNDDPVDDTGHLDLVAERLGVTTTRRPRRTTIATSSGQLSALDWVDDGEAPEYLFAHGGGLNAHAWDSTLMLLNRPARAVDLPGHGWSQWRDDADYAPGTMAPALAETAPATRPFILVGHSLGGMTSLMALPHITPRPAALVIVDISPVSVSRGGAPPRGIFEPGLSWATREEAVDWAMAQGLGRTRETLALGIGFNTRLDDDGRFRFRHHLAHLAPERVRMRHDEDGYWASFDPEVPTVLIQASRGSVSDEQVEIVRERVPWVQVEHVDSGHNVHSQAPEALAEILERVR